MTPKPTAAEAGGAWLAQCSDQPAAVRETWATDSLATLRSDAWRVVGAALPRSVDAMRLSPTPYVCPGPVAAAEACPSLS